MLLPARIQRQADRLSSHRERGSGPANRSRGCDVPGRGGQASVDRNLGSAWIGNVQGPGAGGIHHNLVRSIQTRNGSHDLLRRRDPGGPDRPPGPPSATDGRARAGRRVLGPKKRDDPRLRLPGVNPVGATVTLGDGLKAMALRPSHAFELRRPSDAPPA